MRNECYERKGQVVAINSGEIRVKIERNSACSQCHAGKFCTSLEKKEQILDIPVETSNFQEGEEVIIQIKETLGMRAVLLSFVLPTFVLVLAVFLLKKVFPLLNESIIAAVSLIFYIIYCILLYTFRERLNKTFRISVRRNEFR